MQTYFVSDHEQSEESVHSIKDIPQNERHRLADQTAKDPDVNTYKKVPVENFGQKLLERMGYYEGRGIGRETKYALMKPIELKPRHHRLGLGADPAFNKQNNIQSSKTLNEKNNTIQIGKEVLIIKGKHKGLKGIVIQIKGDVPGERDITVELFLNEETIKLKEFQVSLELEIDQFSESSHSSNKNREEEESEEKEKLKWVLPGLYIKIKSKSYMKGKYYEKKVKVEDLLDQYKFTAITFNGEILEELTEKQIKPTLPDKGERCKIIRGDYKGKIGIFESRDKKNKQVRIFLVDGSEKNLTLKSKYICSYQQ